VPGDHDLYLARFADDNHECLRLLLFHAADAAELGRMALATPISLNDAEGVHLLLKAGADPKRYAGDADPLSPVIYAAIRSGCSAELTGLLPGYGADPHIPGPGGRSRPQRRRSAHHWSPMPPGTGLDLRVLGPTAYDNLRPPGIAGYGVIHPMAEHHVLPTPAGTCALTLGGGSAVADSGAAECEVWEATMLRREGPGLTAPAVVRGGRQGRKLRRQAWIRGGTGRRLARWRTGLGSWPSRSRVV
jgi:hypothetical protein